MLGRLDYAFISVQNQLALNVEKVLNDGASAMENGGALSGFSGKVDEIGGGSYHIVYKVAVYAILVALVVGGIGLAFSSGADRKEKKDNMIWKVIGAVLCFAAAGIIAIAELIGSGLFTGN